MSQGTLKDEFVAMDLYGEEELAVDAWVAAWSAYFSDAETNGIPVESLALPSAEAAMKDKMVTKTPEEPGGPQDGISIAGANAIQAGIIAWWDTIVAAPITFWPGCLAVSPPPGLSGIASALQPVFDSNTSGSVTEEEAYTAIAGIFHPANSGGLATFPGGPPPPQFPIT